MKLKLAAISILFLAAGAMAQTFTVHIQNPWRASPDSGRPAQPVFVTSAVVGPAYPGVAMTSEGNDWWVYTWTLGTKPAANSEFFFSSYVPTAYNATAAAKNFYNGSFPYNFGDAFFKRGVNEIWIKTTGPDVAPIITDIPQGQKVVMLFNPWPDNAPTAKLGSAATYSNMYMSQESNRCGWYGAYFMGKGPYSIAFKSLFGGEFYGIGGLGDAKAIDLSAAFATSDTLFVYPDPVPGGPPKIQATAPTGIAGTCAFKLAVTVRDFSKSHPDFEKDDMKSDVATLGLVTNTLGPDQKPVRSTVPYNHMTDFSHWFADDSTAPAPLTNYTSCQDLNMTKSNGGLWGYDSFKAEASHSYFPIDGKFDRFPAEASISQYYDPATGLYPNDPTGAKHNFSFCMEMHAKFKYKQGQQFNFDGDDDVWAYIDNKLEMDLGGPHPALPGKIDLDKLGLTQGKEYPFDFFYCERHTTGSNLAIQTSIFFEQQQSVFTKITDLPGGGKQYDIYERTSGGHNCGATSTDVEALAKSEFKLSGPSVNPAVVLPIGISYTGITVNAGQTQVTIDTAAVTGLTGGIYTVTFTTTSGKGSSLQFTVPNKNAVKFVSTNPVSVVLGTSVPVNIQVMLGTTVVKSAENFKLMPDAGLLIYSDAALTKPIVAGSDLTTDIDGSFKAYVTSNTIGTYKLDIFGSPTRDVKMDSYGNLTFIKQPQVSKPVASPAGENFLAPIKVTLTSATPGATIFYTLDGTAPAEVAGGSTVAYTAAGITVDKSLTIKAIAILAGSITSDLMTEVYTYTPPVAVKKAWYKDLNGDGMIETVIVEFDKDLPALPAKLAFKISDQTGQTNDRSPAAAEIAFASGSKSEIIVTLASPFPYSVTSVTNADTSGQLFDQPNIPTSLAKFLVDDSVAPVILVGPKVTPIDSLNPLKMITITLSEDAPAFPLTSQTALVFKRGSTEATSTEVKIDHIVKTAAPREYQIFIDSNSTFFPIKGDYVALNTSGEVKDANLNTPSQKVFQILGGIIPAAKPITITVKFPKGDGDHAVAGLLPQGAGTFIPIDQNNAALTGNASDGKCTGCYAGAGTDFVGPVFHLLVSGPTEYDFKIFNNVGEFVASGKGHITADDLGHLKRNGNVNYLCRIVWTGRTDKGERAATGVYILQATMTGTQDLTNGAAAARAISRIRFGMLRG